VHAPEARRDSRAEGLDGTHVGELKRAEDLQPVRIRVGVRVRIGVRVRVWVRVRVRVETCSRCPHSA
jgi:hypothetical protein